MRTLSVLLSLLMLGTTTRSQPLALRADDWCPHTCAPGEGAEGGDGYLVDIVRAALPLHQMNYRLENWARLRERSSAPPQPLLVLLGVGRSERNDRMYFLSRPVLMAAPYCFYKRAGLEAWRYRGPDSLRGLRLTVTHGYHFDDLQFQAYLDAPPHKDSVTRVTGEHAVERHADMLLFGRSDVVLEDREAMRWVFRKRGELRHLQEAGCLDDDTAIHVALPRSDPRAAATLAALEDGLHRLRRSGEMARILARYGIQPPKAATGVARR